MGLGIILAVVIGSTIGVAVHNLALGIGIGIAIGVGIGGLLSRRRN